MDGSQTPLDQRKENIDVTPGTNENVSTDNSDDKEPTVSEDSEKELEKPRFSSETRDNTSASNTGGESDIYAKHVTYNEEGEAIYTDPETKCKYTWSNERNEWVAMESSESNPYENEHYRWCKETNQWIPKLEVSAEKSATETEFYKWDENSKQWIPKTQSANVTYSFEDDVHTYTDADGVKFFWDTEKNAWFPKIDDDFMARYQMNYGFIDNNSKPTEGSQGDVISERSNATTGDESKEKGHPSGGALKRKAQADPPSEWKQFLI